MSNDNNVGHHDEDGDGLSTERMKRRDDLWDYSVDHPRWTKTPSDLMEPEFLDEEDDRGNPKKNPLFGKPIPCVGDELDWAYDYGVLTKAVKDVRVMQADDSINLVCNPQPNVNGKHQPWVYELRSDLDSFRKWRKNRTDDAESRIETIHAVMQSVVRGTDGRSHDGKKARVIVTHLGRLLEDLEQFKDGGLASA
jgi:hypothetical protein